MAVGKVNVSSSNNSALIEFDNYISDNLVLGGEEIIKSTPGVLSNNRAELAATSVGNYALFGGGSGYYIYGWSWACTP